MNSLIRSMRGWVLTGAMACTVSLLAPWSWTQAHAQKWPVAGMEIGDNFASESRYLYVGKGEVWKDATYHVEYLSSAQAFVSVALDGQVIHTQYLWAEGQVNFSLPQLQEGFHRLDFSFTQRGALDRASPSAMDFCAANVDSATSLRSGFVSYRLTRPSGYQLRDLPDALFNPHLQAKRAAVGGILLDLNSAHEQTAIARLAAAWTAAAGVDWRVVPGESPNRTGSFTDIDFVVKLEHFSELEEQAQIALTDEPVDLALSTISSTATVEDISDTPSASVPVLHVRYRDAMGLQNAIYALLNTQYLAQIHKNTATIEELIDPPHWAGMRSIKTLADLGVQDIRLDGNNHSAQLIFPGVWQTTDILRGQLALNVQNGLLQGSKLTVWLNGALAGSLNFSSPNITSDSRTINFQVPRTSGETSFDMNLETTLITNGDCFPRSRGALWIDASKSTVSLPHHIKSGVAGISAALVPQPSIQVDGTPGALDIAISLLQVARKMLLSDSPVPARIVLGSSAGDQKILVAVNPELFQQRVAMYRNKVYASYAQNGVLLFHDDSGFHVIAENAEAAIGFTRNWSLVQAQIADGAQEILLAQDGVPIVLNQYVASTKITPAVKPATLTILGGLIFTFMLLAALWWFWRSRKHKGEQR